MAQAAALSFALNQHWGGGDPVAGVFFAQVVRRLIRAYIEERTGKAWRPQGPTKTAAKGKR